MTAQVIEQAPASPMMELREQTRRERKKPGRKSNEERARIAAERERQTRRARPLPVDTRITLGLTLGIGGISIATAGVISYATMVAVAGWMKLPWDVLVYAVPGFVEFLVVFSSLDYILSRTRGGQARGPFLAMIGFSAVAVLGNAAHTIREWGADFGGDNWQSYIGVALSALAPLVVVYVAKRVTALVFEHPEND